MGKSGKPYDFTLTVGADESAFNQVLALLSKQINNVTKQDNVITFIADPTDVERTLKELASYDPKVAASLSLKIDQSAATQALDFLQSIIDKTNLNSKDITKRFKENFTSDIKSMGLGDILADEVGSKTRSLKNVQSAVDNIVSRITNADMSDNLDLPTAIQLVRDLETAQKLIAEISQNKQLKNVQLDDIKSAIGSMSLEKVYNDIGENIFGNIDSMIEHINQKSVESVKNVLGRLNDILNRSAEDRADAEEKVAEAGEKTAENAKKTADAEGEAADNAERASQAKGKTADETQKEADATGEAAEQNGRLADSGNEAADAQEKVARESANARKELEKEAEEAEDTAKALSELINPPGETGHITKVGSSAGGTTVERETGFAQKKVTNIALDEESGSYKTSSKTIVDYKKLGEAIAEADAEIINLYEDIARNEDRGIDNTATVEKLEVAIDGYKGLMGDWEKLRESPDGIISDKEEEWLQTIRDEAVATAQRNIEAKRATEIAKAHGEALAENARKDKAKNKADELANQKAINKAFDEQEAIVLGIEKTREKILTLDQKAFNYDEQRIPLEKELADLGKKYKESRESMPSALPANENLFSERSVKLAKTIEESAAAFGRADSSLQKDLNDYVAKTYQAIEDADTLRKTQSAAKTEQESYKRSRDLYKELIDLKTRKLSLDATDLKDVEEIYQTESRILTIKEKLNEEEALRSKLGTQNVQLAKEYADYKTDKDTEYGNAKALKQAADAQDEYTQKNNEAAAAYKYLIKVSKEYYSLLYKQASGKGLTGTEDERLKLLAPLFDRATQGAGEFSIAINGSKASIDKATEAMKNFEEVGASVYSSAVAERFKKYEEEFGALGISDTHPLYSKVIDINKGKIDLGIPEQRNELSKLEAQVVDFLRETKSRAKDVSVLNLRNEIGEYLTKNTKLSKEFRLELKKLQSQLQVGISKDQFRSIAASFEKITEEARTAGREGVAFVDRISQRLTDMDSKFLAQILSWHDILRYVRTVASTVTEIDTALTEMRKVSDESVETLRGYQETTYDMADSIGATGLQLQKSTADFMRLGESLENAAESAKAANVLMNVSEFESIDEATESLIAMSAAYKDVSKMDIIDKLNMLGNNYAVSTDGIATALQASASALVTAKNDLDEAAALVTAGNTVIQDPSKVGAGLRTIALRLTGTKQAKEELAELGEETEDFIETQSKLRQIIKDATKAANGGVGFDIQDANGNYKSTYQIMLGLAELYERLEEADKKFGTNNLNLILETIAGKNRSNIAASILQNPDILKNAFDDSKINSANSALEENQKYLESIQGHLNQLKNATDKLYNDLLAPGLINTVLDIAKAFVEVLDIIVEKLGSIGSLTALGGIILTLRKSDKVFSFIRKLSESITLFAGGAKTLTESLATSFPLVGKLVAALNPLTLAVAGVAAVVTGGILLWKKYGDAVKNAEKRLSNAKEEFDNTASNVSSLESELEEMNQQITELENMDSLSFVDQQTLDGLYKSRRLLEENLDLARKANEEAEKTVRTEAINLADTKYLSTEKQSGVDIDSILRGSSSSAFFGIVQDVLNGQRGLETIIPLIKRIEQEYASASDRVKFANDPIQKQIAEQDLEDYKQYLTLLTDYAKEHHVEYLTELINTQRDILGSLDYDALSGDAKSKYDALESLKMAIYRIADPAQYKTIKFNDIFDAEGIEVTHDELVELANVEPITEGDLKKYPMLSRAIEESGLTVQEFVNQLNSERTAIEDVGDAIDKLEFNYNNTTQAVSDMNKRVVPQFDALAKVYNEVFNGDTKKGGKAFDLSHISFDDLQNVSKAFLELDEELGIDSSKYKDSLESFIDVIGNSSSTAEQAHKAFNDLATAFFGAAVSAENFSEENAAVLEQLMKEMGIANSEEVVKYYKDVAKARKELAEAGVDATAFSDDYALQYNQVKNTLAQAMNKLDTPIKDVSSKLGKKFAEYLQNGYKEGLAAQLQDFDFNDYVEMLSSSGSSDTLSKLAEQYESLISIKERLAAGTLDLTNITASEIAIMAQTGVVTEEAAQALYILALKQIFLNENWVNEETSIEQVLTLANAAGIACDALTTLGSIQAELANAKATVASAGSAEERLNAAKQIGELQAKAKAAGKEIETAVGNATVDVKIDVPKTGSGSAGSAGKEAGDSYVEAFEKELKELEELRDAGIISEREFLEKYKALIEKYFKDVDGYAQEYAKRMHDYFSRLKTYYENVFSAINTILDHRINKLNKQKDEAVNALNEEKEAALASYDAQIEAIDNLIEAKNEEIERIDKEIEKYQEQIDNINAAADARKREIDLQKAQYDLERARNQKTRRIYKGGQLVYENDASAERDAREKVEDAEREIAIANIQKKIDALEKEKDLINEQIEALEKQKEAIEKAREATEKYYDKMISDTEKYWDTMIQKLEDIKDKYAELTALSEIADAFNLIREAGEEFGFSVEDVLNDVPGAFEAFKNAYINAIQGVNAENKNYTDALKGALGETNLTFDGIKDAAQNTADALSPIADAAEDINTTASAIENVGAKANSASGSTSTLASSTSELGDALDGVNKSADEFKDVDLTATTESFNKLADAIERVTKALGINADEPISKIKTAIDELSKLSVGDENSGLVKSFNDLASAVTSVTTAIGVAAGGASETEGGDAGAKGTGTGDGEAGASASLIGALEELKVRTDANVGTGKEDEAGTVIGDFTALQSAIQMVRDALGAPDETGAIADDTLLGVISLMPELAQPALEDMKRMFEELLDIIAQCAEAAAQLVQEIAGINSMSLPGGLSMPGSVAVMTTEATGNVHVGNAYADGKLGIKHSETALIGEQGNELVVSPSSGKYHVTNGPEMTKLNKGDLVFNAEQTKAIIKNGKRDHGHSYANGTGLLPLTSVEANFFKAVSEAVEGIKANTEQMLEPVKRIAQNITNVTTNNYAPVINVSGQTFNVSGVTGEDVCRTIQREFNGMIANAYQYASKR